MDGIKTTQNAIVVCMIISLCFFWTGSGYLSWVYNLVKYYSFDKADLISEAYGYVFQAAGLLLFSFLVKKNRVILDKAVMFIATVILDVVFIILSYIVHSALSVLICGYVMNVLHGFVAGFYLTMLARCVKQQNRGIVFGLGYAIGSIGSYLISLIDNGNFLMTDKVLFVYDAFAVLTIIILVCGEHNTDNNGKLFLYSDYLLENKKSVLPDSSLLFFSGLLVLLLSVAKNLGFYFSTAGISEGISIELMRVFYAVGLIVAGIINDKNRKWGAVLCISTLAFPFAMLALKNNLESGTVMWILSYGFFGFFTVYRVLLFLDISGKSDRLIYLAGIGLMTGRLGDAIGVYVGVNYENKETFIVMSAAVLFMITIFFFITIYQKLYIPLNSSNEDGDKRMEKFNKQYSFSPREEDVVLLIIEGLSNAEIADKLFISENTVKFHIKNILNKTDCSNRIELKKLFNEFDD